MTICPHGGVVQKKQVLLGIPNDQLNQRERLFERRRTSISPLQLVQQLFYIEVGSQLALTYIQRCLNLSSKEERTPYPCRSARNGSDLSSLSWCILYCRKRRGDQLKIADIRKEVRLHDGQPHLPPLIRPLV